ncbi:hypothetical protein GCM10022409_21130 [Hymenobacter glaciei]|uniref:NADH:quinone oxidoreductase/Mrp antiporter membrane subunit domain-containing protein n=1 Tax=Hymenobacter glaciei TaxID=877209 RepID=A0ABP7U4N5_9BACT
MKVIDNLLLLARFSLMMGILIIPRVFSPHLTDSALSEQEYAEGEPLGLAPTYPTSPETRALYAAVEWEGRGPAAGAFGRQSAGPRYSASRQRMHQSPHLGNGPLRRGSRP